MEGEKEMYVCVNRGREGSFIFCFQPPAAENSADAGTGLGVGVGAEEEAGIGAMKEDSNRSEEGSEEIVEGSLPFPSSSLFFFSSSSSSTFSSSTLSPSPPHFPTSANSFLTFFFFNFYVLFELLVVFLFLSLCNSTLA
jgi:hypothetical protein